MKSTASRQITTLRLWLSRAYRVVCDRPATVLMLAATLILAKALYPRFVLQRYPAIHQDSALFEYAGWAATQGALVYRDLWDVKPPAAFELTAGLAVLTGGRPFALHLASAVLMGATLIATVGLVVVLVRKFTGDSTVALAAGMVIFAYPRFYLWGIRGIRPKTFAFFFGLLGIYLYFEDQPVTAGASAAFAAAFWQFASVFFVVLSVRTYQNRDWLSLKSLTLGAGVSFVVVVWPFVARGAVGPMFVQTVIAPLLTPEGAGIIERVFRGVEYLTLTLPVVVVGGVGALLAWRDEWGWWVTGIAVWSLVQVFLFDFDAQGDLFLGYLAVVFGFAHLFERWRDRTRTIALLVLSALGVLLLVRGGVDGFIPGPGGPPRQGTMVYAFWNQTATHCHMRLTEAEQIFIERIGVDITERTCGPYDVVRLLRIAL